MLPRRIRGLDAPDLAPLPTTGELYCLVNDISLCYEAIGDPNAEDTVVLIMGLGLQLVWWRDDFCAELARRSMRVVRFDNRDVGRSRRRARGRSLAGLADRPRCRHSPPRVHPLARLDHG